MSSATSSQYLALLEAAYDAGYACPAVPVSSLVTANATLKGLGDSHRSSLKELHAEVSRTIAEPIAAHATVECTIDDGAETANTEVAAAGTNDGDGDDGSKDDGGGDSEDPEPPIDWWLVAFLVASVCTLGVLLALSAEWKPNRHYLTVLVGAFFVTFGLTILSNPKRWYRRMTEASFTALCGSLFAAGVALRVPVPWSATPIALYIPSGGPVTVIVLGGLTMWFGWLEHCRERPQ